MRLLWLTSSYGFSIFKRCRRSTAHVHASCAFAIHLALVWLHPLKCSLHRGFASGYVQASHILGGLLRPRAEGGAGGLLQSIAGPRTSSNRTDKSGSGSKNGSELTMSRKSRGESGGAGEPGRVSRSGSGKAGEAAAAGAATAASGPEGSPAPVEAAMPGGDAAGKACGIPSGSAMPPVMRPALDDVPADVPGRPVSRQQVRVPRGRSADDCAVPARPRMPSADCHETDGAHVC